jgi:CubicO group peptidase (beta-lactamase class C family)
MMKVPNILLSFALFFHTTSITVHSQTPDKPLKDSIREYLRSQQVSGSVLVVKGDKVIFNEGVGLADRSRAVPNLPSTTFPIGSITKAMVAVCILQLQETGKLSINDRLSMYLPEFPNSKNIKLSHLLNHTSGIPDIPLGLGFLKPINIVNKAANKQSKFSAGLKWDYNDLNYMILGLIIEKVTKESLQQYIKKNIFKRASMFDSGFITENDGNPDTSKGYVRVANHYLPAKKLNTAMLFGCGDIYSTPYNLYLFDRALMSGELVSNNSLKQMLTPGSQSKYGMGLYTNDTSAYSRGVLSGWEGIHVYFKNEIIIVILLNVHDKRINIHKLSRDIYGEVNLPLNLPD